MSKRAERRRRTAVVVQRRMAWLYVLFFDENPNPNQIYPDWPVGEDWETYHKRQLGRALGRCRKLHPLDCGKTHCGVCSWHKRWMRGKTRQELKMEVSFHEQLAEI